MTAPAVKSGRGRAKSCPASEKPSDSLPAARVTIRPVAVEIRSAGICAARPSPTVRMLKVWSASENVRPCCSIPITMPAKRLTATMIRPATASPRTNFEAPSIAP